MANKAFGVSNINATGSVGIGTDNPAGKLHISSGDSGDCVMIIEADTDNNDESDNPKILFRQDGGSDWSAIGNGINLSGGVGNNSLVLANSVASSGGIIFQTGSSNGYTNASERLRITSAGAVQIANGNLVFSTSGTGIDFSATSNSSGTMSSELLDDYEEGTFTPEFANAASGGTESSSYTTQDGRYTKIGNLVHVDIFLRNVVTTSLGTGAFFVRGLPFAVKSGSIYIGQAGLSNVDLNSTASSLYSFANAESGAISALRVFQTKDDTSHSAVPCDAVNSGTNEVFITMTYPTDS